MQTMEKRELANIYSEKMTLKRMPEEIESTFCRLCATDVGTLLPIFGEEGERCNLLEKVSRCTPIIVHREDCLPQYICQRCIEKLNESYELVITALNAEIYLKSKYKMFDDLQCSNKLQENDTIDSDEDDDFCDPIGPVVPVTSFDNGVIVRRKLSGKSLQTVKSESEHVSVIRNTNDILESADDFEIFILNVHGPAECDVCEKIFTDMDAFDKHVSTQHLLNEPFECSECDESFPELPDLLYHKAGEHSGDVISCDDCNSKLCSNFEAGSSCEQHTVSIFECKFCSAIFDGKNLLEEHYTECHSSNKTARPGQGRCSVFTCKACEEVFPDENAFNYHMKLLQSSPVLLTCSICSKRFCEQGKLHLHTRIHEKEYKEQFKCKVCSYLCPDNQSLSIHLKSHTGIKSHMCDLCGRTFNRISSMIKHRKLHKPVYLWEHTCNQCDTRFEKLDEMMSHVERVHDKTKITQTAVKTGGREGPGRRNQFKWICRFCGKRISTKLSLQDHERIHTGDKPYICEWCGREFRSRPNLLQHHLTHTGDRRHSCEVCGKRFARKAFIAQHMRVHTGEKPYECDICGHRFTQAGDMRRHRRRHVDLKTAATNTPLPEVSAGPVPMNTMTAKFGW